MSNGRATSVLYLLKILDTWLNDDAVTEICINRPGEVEIETNTGWTFHKVPELDYERCLSLAIAVAKYHNDEISELKPILSAQLPNKERIQITIPPACEHGIILIVIRKPPSKTWTMEELEDQGYFNKIKPVEKYSAEDRSILSEKERHLLDILEDGKYKEFIKQAIAHDQTMIIAGATGAGKTSFMRTIVQHIPRLRRILTIEDVRELYLHPDHTNNGPLMYPSEGEKDKAVTTSTKQIRNCLRNRPDRILLAELRGPEAFDFINAAMSGHDGSITTLHAGSLHKSFKRLRNLMRTHEEGVGLPYDVIMDDIYQTVDIVMHCYKDPDTYDRYITAIWYDPKIKYSELNG